MFINLYFVFHNEVSFNTYLKVSVEFNCLVFMILCTLYPTSNKPRFNIDVKSRTSTTLISIDSVLSLLLWQKSQEPINMMESPMSGQGCLILRVD